ncbi:hypothetical protein DV737_g3642, partial [Chaetothyriales sp. CBS 132003]
MRFNTVISFPWIAFLILSALPGSYTRHLEHPIKLSDFYPPHVFVFPSYFELLDYYQRRKCHRHGFSPASKSLAA